MTHATVAIFTAFILIFALVSRKASKSIVTPPMAFVAVGLLLSPQLLGLVRVDVENETVKMLTEATLTLVLFTDASRIHFKHLRRQQGLPERLLSVALPLNILFGTLLAMLLFGEQFNLWEAAVIGTILAPTDPALASAVVGIPRLPVRVRQTINVESGLNDGICLPILLIFLSLAQIPDKETTLGALGVAQQLILGPIAGIAVGYIGGWLITHSVRKKWINESFEDISALAIPFLAYSLAELAGGNGFLAAFCAGLTLGNTARPICSSLHEFGEAEGQLLILITFGVYGAIMVVPSLERLNWQIVLYAVLSLTVVRSAAVAISLIGRKLRWETLAFLSWFGPRGVASILYALMAFERHNIPHRETIFAIAIFTVFISVFAHGFTSYPGSCWYASRMDLHKTHPEHHPVGEMPVRFPWREDN